MPAFKWTMRIKYISGAALPGYLNKAGSFTESVHWTSGGEGTRQAFLTLCRKRAGFLPNYTAITGIRVQQVDPSGPGQLQRVFIPGQAAVEFTQDIPQMAFLFSFPTSLTNVRKYIAAGIPDVFSKRGEPSLDNTDKALIRRWLLELNGWLSRGEDLTKVKVPVKTISALGVVDTTADIILAPQSTVKIYSAVDAFGKAITDQFQVENVANSKQFTLRGWTAGACTLGSVRQISIVYPVINTLGYDLEAISVTTRKIGRPFEKYVGQRRRGPRKRRTA